MRRDGKKVKVESAYGDGQIVDIIYSDGRKAQFNYDKTSDFYATVTTKDGKVVDKHLASDYFKNLLEKIVILSCGISLFLVIDFAIG